jgi:hypothetical protein
MDLYVRVVCMLKFGYVLLDLLKKPKTNYYLAGALNPNGSRTKPRS